MQASMNDAAGGTALADAHAAVRAEIVQRRRAEATMRFIIAHAKCILWHGAIEGPENWREETDGSSFHWHLSDVHDPAAAQAVVPLDLSDGRTYLQAWAAARHPDDARAADRVSAAALRSGRSSYSQEFRCHDRYGREHWLFEDVYLESEGPGLWRAVGVCTDITNQKRAQAQHEQLLAEQAARAEAQRANRAKDHFLAILSHELRTPLGPVLAVAAAMERQDGLPAEMKGDLELIRRNVELEARLIDDLLDISRIAEGKLALRMGSVDVHQALLAACETCRADMQAKGIDLSVRLAAPAHVVGGDPARLQQVFWNLLKNAVKFTPGGGAITIRTKASAGPSQPRLSVEVSDTGIGIDPVALPRIFDAFEQAEESITHRFGGLGLGLAIARHLVEAHGGKIAAASAGVGRGATFTVELPLLVGPSHCGTRPISAGQEGDRRQPKTVRLLLVEDHPDMLRIMARLLRGAGYEVTPAGSVEAALKTLAGGEFDLLISDLALGDGDGFELMRQAREKYGISGIAVSGCAMPEDLEMSRAAGFSEHLTKPITLEQLEEAIKRVGR